MSNAFIPAAGWGPEAKRAALCLTFDNFGEACELEVGWWGDKPVGQHFTADFIPELIATLGEFHGTYFMEASNAKIYPDAIKRWYQAGNEVGLHAWRHEIWAKCEAPQRRDILRRCTAAMAEIGIETVGFRPPGGEALPDVWPEFQEAGLLYASDLSTQGIRQNGKVLSLPFMWPHVDAFYFEDIAAQLRVKLGYQEAAYAPEYWGEVLDQILERIVADGTQATIIFHPHLLGSDPRKLAVLRAFLDKVRRQDVWVGRARDVADFILNEMKSKQPADKEHSF